MGARSLKIRTAKASSISTIENWSAELVGDPDIASDALYPFLSFHIRVTNGFKSAARHERYFWRSVRRQRDR